MSFEGIDKLRNRYFAVRHGESEANVAHLISSNPELGTKIHGLSPNGRNQVSENTKLFLENHPEENSFVIISSDFRRAYETAEILATNLPNKLKIQIDQRLRERFFGIYDNTSDENYHLIWKTDEENPMKNVDDQVETVESVRKRTTELIRELEETYDNQLIFLISHGDALQILQTAFERLPNANQQRHLKHIERAEFRELILK
jgi:probable phosphoglycerate mutase